MQCHWSAFVLSHWKHHKTGWWFGTFFIFPLGRIIPTDFHIFQGGRYTTNQISMSQTFQRWSRFSRPSVIISWSRFLITEVLIQISTGTRCSHGVTQPAVFSGYTHFRLSSASASWNESILWCRPVVNQYNPLISTWRYGYGSIAIHSIFRGMNIHVNPEILMWTEGG